MVPVPLECTSTCHGIGVMYVSPQSVGLSRFKMDIRYRSMHVKREAWSISDSDKSASLVHCKATLKVRLTFRAVE